MSRFKYKFFYCGLCLVFWVLIICFQPSYDVIRNEIANTYQTEYAYLIYLYEVCLAFVFELKNFFSRKVAYKIYMINESISVTFNKLNIQFTGGIIAGIFLFSCWL